ncbi:glycoside hydrolase family 3 protein [Saccharopolyspora karakumensis]|uniref:Glycoside hydrolase family 3 protein n=1 Tax=Saccharopolyspora karakumensis TaxID=2530386 RepID=A0A4V2YXF0_9PSEU|nr:glycoside hydrolase family 3 C-terminal domain-containing protein [Saccharopolyspora karakumensis]TDD89197.1 glycoside hydrolase family 3 protein [Saccharopolyspora karakumensis]
MTGYDEAELPSMIDKAIGVLDLARKVRLLTGAAMFALPAEPAIGLSEVRLSDGPTGLRGAELAGGRKSCLLPNATLLAQHWDVGVAEQVGELLADEAAAHEVHVVLGPTINLHRSPLGGRLFEAFSEDPLLSGALATGYVRGLQARGIATSPKHFLANESETERFTVDCAIDERTVREVYLLPFEMVVADARPWSVMASYNQVNGTPASEHRELIENVLKGEWGYDGLVMSDWFATTSTAASANGGLDLVMPGPDGPWGEKLVAAVEAGDVAEETIDEHLRRLLRFAARVGCFPGEPASKTTSASPDSPQTRERLRHLAAGGMTVLVNRDNTLPLATSGGRVAVIGRHAFDTVAQGGGSAQIRPPHVVSIADGLTGALGTERVSAVDGVEVRTRPLAAEPGAVRDPHTGESGMRVTAWDAAGAVLESRHVDGTEIEAVEDGWLGSAASIELSAELVLDEPARTRIGVRGPGRWELTAPGLREELELHRAPGPGGGLHRPPARGFDVEQSSGARISAVTRADSGMRIIGLVAAPAPPTDDEAIQAATAAARESEVAVVVVGYTQEQETEGVDKTTLALPGRQDELVLAVVAVAERTVVVVNAATPALMPWIDEVDAVLWAGLPGQEAGDAVAAALLGEVEPAGRLVTTFPAADRDGPGWNTTPTDGVLTYAEGGAVGYRGWRGRDPLFWFGHGLGYGTWRYETVEPVAEHGIATNARVQVTNTGDRTSREIVQVYARPADPDEPIRLVGWAGAIVEPGRTATVAVPCDQRTQRRWDPDTRAWSPLPNTELLIARGLGDVRLTLPLSEEN